MSEITGSEEVADPFVQRFHAIGHDIDKQIRLQHMVLRTLAAKRGQQITRWRIAHPNATWELTAAQFGISPTRLRELRRKGLVH